MNLIAHRARLSVGSTLACVLLLAGLVLACIVDETMRADDTLENIAPRHARLAGLRESADVIGQSAAVADTALAHYAHPATAGTDRIGTDLQQRLRAAAEAAGVGVVGSQIVSGKADNGLEDIPVSMTLEADLGQLQQMLQAVGELTPAVYVDSINIQRARGRNADPQRLTTQVRFSVLRRLP